MAFYTLEPEVAGELGDSTTMDTTQHPPLVRKLEYIFSDWFGDSLVASFPVFMVTKELAEALAQADLHGFELDKVKISTSPEFKELDPAPKLPDFAWLKITGKAGQDDFGIADNHLVVSERALRALKNATLEQCTVTPLK